MASGAGETVFLDTNAKMAESPLYVPSGVVFEVRPLNSNQTTTTQTILEKHRTLLLEQQQEILDFVEFLQQKSITKDPRRSLKGLWADLGVCISEEDITKARRVMWKKLEVHT